MRESSTCHRFQADNGLRVSEVVGHTGGKLDDSRQPLRLHKHRLRLPALGNLYSQFPGMFSNALLKDFCLF